jgi:hypothetical protein
MVQPSASHCTRRATATKFNSSPRRTRYRLK